MRPHQGGQFLQRFPLCDGQGEFTHQIGGPLTHELRPQHRAGLGMGHHLDKAPFRASNDAPPIAVHQVLASLCGNPRLLGLGLGEPHRGNLRFGVDTGGDGVQLHGRLFSRDHTHSVDRLGRGHMCQLNAARHHVSNGIDALHAGLEPLIHRDRPPVQSQVHAGPAQALGVGRPPGGDQHGVRRNGFGLFL